MAVEIKKDVLSYVVPTLTPDGTCSADKGFEDKPYDLRDILNITNETQETFVIEQIRTLYGLIDEVQERLHADWLGIYQVATNKDNVRVLVKLAYVGAPSRAEFPLTRDFALLSNNSTVGLSGKAAVIDSIVENEGAYYVCDAQVNSEACLPIFAAGSSKVVGIIDAESFVERHFGDENVALLTNLCQKLSDYLPLPLNAGE